MRGNHPADAGAHVAHTWRYGERDARAREREEGERWKAREGAQGSQCQHDAEGGDDQGGRRHWGRRLDAYIHLLTYLALVGEILEHLFSAEESLS